MLSSIFLNILLISFPFFLYFIYLVYSRVITENEKILFLDLTILSSFYLSIKFGDFSAYYSLLINIPLFIALYLRRDVPIIILSILVSYHLSNIFGINFYILFIKYILIFTFSKLSKKNIKILYISVTFIFLVLIIIFNIYKFDNYLFIPLYIILCYLLFLLIDYIYDKFKNIKNSYETLDKILKEKKLYESLFKITHEIKNPLAVCKGYLDMFDINNKSKSNRYINIINQEIDRTLLLLNDFSKACKLEIDPMIMDINMLLSDVCDEAKLLLNNIKFDYKLYDEEIYIYGDYNRLKQVFINIIKNAKEAISENGKIEFYSKINKNNIIIYIKDNGIGIKEDELDKIGTAFYTTKKNGTGLGVCFSKEIIEKHNGSIKYTSNGIGTIVKVSLPIKKTSI